MSNQRPVLICSLKREELLSAETAALFCVIERQFTFEMETEGAQAVANGGVLKYVVVRQGAGDVGIRLKVN